MLARSVLSWITYAQRPLSTKELCHALAVELGELELDLDNIPDVEDMVSVCAGLVVVDDESNIIRLVHYTTQEYFERIRESWNPRAQQEIASTCLTYLSFKVFASGASGKYEDLETRIYENPFCEYAATYWAAHSLSVQKEIAQLALPFLLDQALVASTIQLIPPRKYSSPWYSFGFRKHTTGLHLTAAFGLLFLFEELLRMADGTIFINAGSRDGYGRTPLLWAAMQGQEAMVKLLLTRDDVKGDSKDERDRTPLSWAAYNGHETVIKILLTQDKEENNKNENYQTTN